MSPEASGPPEIRPARAQVWQTAVGIEKESCARHKINFPLVTFALNIHEEIQVMHTKPHCVGEKMKIKNLIIVMFLFVIMQCSCHKSKIKDEENLVLTIKLNEIGRVSSLIESATGYVDAAASYCPEDHNLWQNTVNSRNKKESLKMLCPIEWERELVVSLSGTWSGNKLDRFRVLAPDGKVLLDELLEKRDPGVKKIVIDTSKLPPPRGKP